MPKTVKEENNIEIEEFKKQLLSEVQEEAKNIYKEIKEKAEKEAKEIIEKAKLSANAAEPKGEISESKKAMKKYGQYLNERVPIEFFKGGSEFQADVFVGVNDYSALIKRGEPVMVPRYVAMLIAESRAQEIKANNVMEDYIKRYEESRAKYGI